jgi:transcription elongation factor Elf1
MKKWYICPYCSKKIIKYKEGANSKGVFLLCKKCGKEIEIKINNKEK